MTECLQPSLKHSGGSVMASGYIHPVLLGDHGKCLMGNYFVFHHKYDPKHRAKAVKHTSVGLHTIKHYH